MPTTGGHDPSLHFQHSDRDHVLREPTEGPRQPQWEQPGLHTAGAGGGRELGGVRLMEVGFHAERDSTNQEPALGPPRSPV